MFGSNDEHLEIMGITLQMPTLTFEAESISYLVCQHFGIETSPNSFGYLANYGDENLTELKVSLDTIRKSANALIVGIEEQFKQISRERETPAPQQNDVTSTEPITAEESAQIKEYMDDLVSEKAVNKSNLLLPDPSISADERDAYGYKFADMLPLTKDRALELFDGDNEVFLLHEDNSESMAFDRSEIEKFDGIFGIERGDWERSAEFKAKSEVATEHTEILTEEPHDNNVLTSSAVNSNYKNMVALVGNDDNIYLGKSENYHFNTPYIMPWHDKDKESSDAPSFYDNSDNSLIFISQNDKMYGFIAHEGLLCSQEKALDKDVFTINDYLEFAKLEKNVLSELPYKDNFDGYKFAGEPFMSPFKEREINGDCCQSITNAIAENFSDNRLSTDAAKSVVEQFGMERVNLVLANTLQYKHYDGRFSQENKDWANKTNISELQIPKEQRNYYLTEAHPALLDGFVRQVRKIADEKSHEKPSVLGAIKENAKKSKQQAIKPEKAEPKKDKGLEV